MPPGLALILRRLWGGFLLRWRWWVAWSSDVGAGGTFISAIEVDLLTEVVVGVEDVVVVDVEVNILTDVVVGIEYVDVDVEAVVVFVVDVAVVIGYDVCFNSYNFSSKDTALKDISKYKYDLSVDINKIKNKKVRFKDFESKCKINDIKEYLIKLTKSIKLWQLLIAKPDQEMFFLFGK